MHTFIDLVGGFILGWIILVFWGSIEAFITHWTYDAVNTSFPWLQILFLVTLPLAYPTPLEPTPSRKFVWNFSFSCIGVILGNYTNRQHLATPILPQLIRLDGATWLRMVARFIVGLPVIVVNKELTKSCGKALSKCVYKILGKHAVENVPRGKVAKKMPRVWSGAVAPSQQGSISAGDVIAGYFSYAAVGWSAAHGALIVMHLIGLS